MSSFGQPPGGGGGFGQPPGGGGFGQPPGGSGGGFEPPPGSQPGGGQGFGQPAGPGGYGGPPGGPGPGGFGPSPEEGPKNEQLAIVSVVLGGLSIPMCCCGCVPIPIAAVVCGVLALQRINKDPQALKGKELAYAGIGLGAVFILLTLVWGGWVGYSSYVNPSAFPQDFR
ncbi:MAG: DUF4190 domain-containing protein [Sandaracinaceae bacterium]